MARLLVFGLLICSAWSAVANGIINESQSNINGIQSSEQITSSESTSSQSSSSESQFSGSSQSTSTGSQSTSIQSNSAQSNSSEKESSSSQNSNSLSTSTGSQSTNAQSSSAQNNSSEKESSSSLSSSYLNTSTGSQSISAQSNSAQNNSSEKESNGSQSSSSLSTSTGSQSTGTQSNSAHNNSTEKESSSSQSSSSLSTSTGSQSINTQSNSAQNNISEKESSSSQSSNSDSKVNHISNCSKPKPAPPQCGSNEERKCVQPCPPQKSCKNRNAKYFCPAVIRPCKLTCVCKPGFYRNAIGVCITEAQCNQCSKPNEFFSCGGACDNECSTLGLQNRTSCPIINIVCNPKCYCEDGFARDSKGNCIPVNKCNEEPKPLQCGPNEVVDDCPYKCGSERCPRSEQEANISQVCVKPDKCPPPACRCQFNYSRDRNGKCIPTRDCPAFLCKGRNEAYNSCPPLCPTDDCSQATPTGKCPLLGRIGIVLRCKPTCRCIKGYWRKNGVCVPYAECKPESPPCGKNEERKCIQPCPYQKTCANRNLISKIACPKPVRPCKSTCVCKPGFFRNAIGECITAAQCDQCRKPNEVFSCGGACDNECSTLGKQNRTNCPIINVVCNPKCYCADGYARDSKGNCIPISNCTKEPQPLQCRPNEVVDDCPYKCGSERCPRSEQEANLSQVCVKPDKCPPPACRCGFNYSRDRNGKCIPTRDCPAFSCEGKNEEYNSCPPLCPSDDCSQATPTGKCPFPGRIGIVLRCKPTCRCKKGYWRKNDVCVPYEQCTKEPQPLQCGPNEVVDDCPYKCGSESCPRSEQEANLSQVCVKPDKCPPPACRCGFNYSRDRNGKCIPTRDCPAFSCEGKNEEYNSCPPLCPSDDCSQATPTGKCPLPGRISILRCKPRCRCKKGYWRKNDVCVPYEQCNEPNGCKMDDIYSGMEITGTGLQYKEPKPLVCGPNEEEQCVKPCPPERTCRRRVNNLLCIKDDNPCKRKCVCKPGYFRNSIGQCISEAQCDQCSKPNEFFSCGSACDNECSTINKQNRTNCPIINVKCNEKCYCDDGYARDGVGKCVPINECRPTCGRNEVNVFGKSCPPDTCLSLVAKFKCNSNEVSKNRCRCKPGYLRLKAGSPCIPKCECPQLANSQECKKPKPLVCGPNEEEQCVKPCPPERTCRRRVNNLFCIKDDNPCKKKCVCKPGYFRNSIGECISEAQCDQCSKPNEFFSCGSACDNECSTINKQNRTNCPIINVKCNEKCYCDDGYARDGVGKCVPINECKPTCGRNEVNVFGKSCPPDTCLSLVAKFRCNSNEVSKNRCRCKPGYLRLKAGSPCVPKCQCPQLANSPECKKPRRLECGPNEEEQCVKPCPPERTCRRRVNNVLCIKDNNPCKRKCVCKPGFFRNSVGQCITEAQCDRCSKPNEFYSCGTACDNECSTIGKQNRTNCPIINKKCNERCYCDDGYARDGSGMCVPIIACNQPKCGRNEEYVLAKSCPPDECFSLVAKIKCDATEVEKYRCRCKSGFLRKKAGAPCEPICNCKELASSPECAKPPKCGVNEELVLGKSCPPDTCISMVAFFNCDSNEKDQFRCRCKPGYLRLKPGSPCVKTCNCSELGGACDKPKPLVCARNEEEQCVKRCPSERTCRRRGIIEYCKKDDNPCKKKCVCKPGYFRNSIGQCITAAQCDRCNKPNEFFSCGSACDNECSTINKQNRTNCPIINIKCNERCYCDDGYARDGSGKCVPVNECNRPKCGRNEEYVLAKSCPPDECFSLVAKIKCDATEVEKYRCRCKSGFLRKKAGAPCEPICNCKELASSPECAKPPKCGANEELVLGKSCPPDTCISMVAFFNCDSNEKDQFRCRCKPGYLRLKPGSPCVKTCNCSELGGACDKPKPLVCARNEEEQCVKRCLSERTCRRRGIIELCKKDDSPCKRKCVCKPGYFRNSIGQCITAAQCDRCNKPNEFFSCGSACDSECSTINKQNRTNCPIINIKCNERCYCDDGYARDGSGKCVPVNECNRPKCGRNEEYVLAKSCPPDECFSLVAKIKCDATEVEKYRCRCKSGFLRKKAGAPCEPICNCKELASSPECAKPPKCGANEELVLGKSCPPDTCISMVAFFNCDSNEKDQFRCRCKPGYLRLKPGSPCVKTCNCSELGGACDKPKPLVCARNEEEQCVKRCPSERTCRRRGIIELCKKDDSPCKRKCVCKPGYFRNSIGQCITAAQCDRCNKPNEFFSCGSACDNVCSTINKQNRTNCPIINIKCNERCYCDDGYARDGSGKCVPVNECKQPKCGRNEEYILAKNCPPDECFALVAKFKCDATEVEKYRCRCKSGFLRKKAGAPCEPICNCKELASSPECAKPPKCGANEELVLGKSCPPDTCISVVALFKCDSNEKDQFRCRCKPGYLRLKPGSPCVKTCNCPELGGNCDRLNESVCGLNEEVQCVKPCPSERTCRRRGIIEYCKKDDNPCKRKCVCKPGYFRNSIGECITGGQCDRCNKPNEFFSCGSACDNECSTISKQNRTNCPIINKKCNERCYCDDGYARDGCGKCVPINECNSSKPRNTSQSTATSSISISPDGQTINQSSNSQTSKSSVSEDGNLVSQSSGQESSTLQSTINSEGSNLSSSQAKSEQNNKQQIINNAQGSSRISDQSSSQQASNEQIRKNKQGSSLSRNQSKSHQSSYQQVTENAQGSSQISNQSSNQQISSQQVIENAQGSSQSSNQSSNQQISDQQIIKNAQGSSQSSNQSSNQQISSQQITENAQGSSQFSNQSSNQQISSQKVIENAQGSSQSSNQSSSQQISDQQIIKKAQGSSQSINQSSSQKSSNQQIIKNTHGSSQTSKQSSSQQDSSHHKSSSQQKTSSARSSSSQSSESIKSESALTSQSNSSQSSSSLSSSSESNIIQTGGQSVNSQSSSGEIISSLSSSTQSSSTQSSSSQSSSSQSSSFISSSNENSNSNSQLQPLQCDKNEEVRCVRSCPPQITCENRNAKYSCQAVVSGSTACKNTCVCKPGYYRNALGTCITAAQCNQCSKPNEFFACDSACDNECRTILTQGRKNCPIKNIVCNERCYCKDGYARDAKGNCVPECQCPQLARSPKCKKPCH